MKRTAAMNAVAVSIAITLAQLLAACSPHPEPARAETFTIETDRLAIRVEGDPAAFEQHAPQILTRIDAVDPALIRPGIGIWADPEKSGEEWEPDRPVLVLIGRVVAVEPRVGGY